MDFLSHLFLPLTAVYVLRVDLFRQYGPWALAMAGFGVLPDADKFLGVPGLFHSVVTLSGGCIVLLIAEHRFRSLYLSPVVTGLILSHLILDFVDGGPVLILFPLLDTGLGLQYPAQVVFGTGPIGVWIDGPVMTLRTAAPDPGFNSYGFIRGSGVASALLFAFIYVVDQVRVSNRTNKDDKIRAPLESEEADSGN